MIITLLKRAVVSERGGVVVPSTSNTFGFRRRPKDRLQHCPALVDCVSPDVIVLHYDLLSNVSPFELCFGKE